MTMELTRQQSSDAAAACAGARRSRRRSNVVACTIAAVVAAGAAAQAASSSAPDPDHFHLPPEDDGLRGMDGCAGDVCNPFGLQPRDQWRLLQERVLFETRARFGDATT